MLFFIFLLNTTKHPSSTTLFSFVFWLPPAPPAFASQSVNLPFLRLSLTVVFCVHPVLSPSLHFSLFSSPFPPHLLFLPTSHSLPACLLFHLAAAYQHSFPTSFLCLQDPQAHHGQIPSPGLAPHPSAQPAPFWDSTTLGLCPCGNGAKSRHQGLCSAPLNKSTLPLNMHVIARPFARKRGNKRASFARRRERVDPRLLMPSSMESGAHSVTRARASTRACV